jgi:muramoyltetrapeptide carboxypeptidase
MNPIFVTNGRMICPGHSKGRLSGGNISTISHLLGTRFHPDFNGCILFLEDIGEPAYKIDRMITQMKMAGLFKGIRGVILGSFENCKNPEYLEEILSEVFEDTMVPVLWGLASGHGPVNLSLFMGKEVEMDTRTQRIGWI